MKKPNIRSEIIRHSRELFQEQGYSATTVRQIAKRTGCTAGSLYYFFEGGKTEILQEVIRSYGFDPAHSFSWFDEVESLDGLVDQLVIELPQFFQKRSKQLNWLLVDIPHMGQEEKAMMRRFPLALYESILRGVRQHIADRAKSTHISWLIYSALHGYLELYNRIGPVVDEDFCIEEMGETVKTAVSALAGQGDNSHDKQ